MRITAELVAMSPQFLNPIRERELDLRGNKIAIIENLGTTKDAFDRIDLSDNEIRRLENVPLLKRLRCIMFCNNRINFINGESLAESAPNLDSLILTNNLLREFSQIESLHKLKKLSNLSLLDNAVTRKENYRLYLIFLIPSLKVLDFKKVKQDERQKAKQLFGDVEKQANTFVPGEMMEQSPEDEEQEQKKELSAEQKSKIRQALSKAPVFKKLQD